MQQISKQFKSRIPQHQCFDLWSLLQEVDFYLDSHAAAKGFFCNIDIDPNAPRFFYGSPGEIIEIICTMATYSLSHLKKGGTVIQIKTFPTDKEDFVSLVIQSSDTGSKEESAGTELEKQLARFTAKSLDGPHDHYFFGDNRRHSITIQTATKRPITSPTGWENRYQIETKMRVAGTAASFS
jgi:hypothetical protein